MPNIIKRMSNLRHFKNLSIKDLGRIVSGGRIRKVRANTMVVIEDESCAGLFVLLSGQIHLYRLGPDGQEVLLYVINPVSMFNEVSILDGGPNLLTAVAAKNSVLWTADYKTLSELSKKFPQVALGFLPVLAARHRELIDMVADVCFRSVRARTAKLLLDLSDYGQQPIKRQEHSIYKMSAQVSTVPEAISRSLSFFKDQEYIVSSRSTIIVCQADRLADLAQIGDDSRLPTCKTVINSN